MILPWMRGQPEAVLELARSMDLGVMRLAGILGSIAPISTKGSWESPAGEEFGQALGQVIPTMSSLAERYRGAVAVLRTYAGDLDAAQVKDRWLREAHVVAEDRWSQLQREESGLRASPADLEVNRAAQRDALWTMTELEQAQRTVREEFDAADRKCAARLQALADDRLTDSAMYDLVSNINGTSSALGPVALALAFTPLAPLSAVIGLLNSTSQFGMLVLYQEGSWKEFGVNVGLSATGLSASSLKVASQHGGTLVKGTPVGKYVGTGARLRAGTRKAATKRVDDYVKKFTGGAKAGTKTARPLPTGQQNTLGYRAGAKVRAMLDEKVLNDLEMAVANGPNAQRLYLASLATTTGLKAGKTVPKVVAAFDSKTVNSGMPCGKGPTWTKSQHNLSLGVCQEQR